MRFSKKFLTDVGRRLDLQPSDRSRHTPNMRNKKWRTGAAWVDFLAPFMADHSLRRGAQITFLEVQLFVPCTFDDYRSALAMELIGLQDAVPLLVRHIATADDFFTFCVDSQLCDAISDGKVMAGLLEQFERVRPMPTDCLAPIRAEMGYEGGFACAAWVGLFLGITTAPREEWQRFLDQLPGVFGGDSPEWSTSHLLLKKVATVALQRALL